MSKATTQRAKVRTKLSVKRAVSTGSTKHERLVKRSATPTKTPVRTKTLRLTPLFEEGLAMLKGVLKKPINKMVNEAVGEYIARRTTEVEAQLTTTLDELKAYRLADPEFSAARQAFIQAEARHGKEDPMEGRLVTVTPPAGVPAGRRPSVDKPTASSQEGPAVSMLREVLRG